ncbi:MAG: hypothetical protein HY898_20225 [Deltaproteobacteria bacterium]|nr:hypothetical protein [Deltaproteobacteria bacterium]
MPEVRSRLIALGLGGVILAFSSAASAQSTAASDDEPKDEQALRHVRLEALGGAGFGKVTISTGETVNGYGPVLALRAAWRFSFGGVVGVRYDHFFGTTSEYPWSGVARVGYRTGASIPGIELGYELLLPHAFVRPHVAVAAGWLRRSVECNAADGSYAAMADQLCAEAESSESARRSLRIAFVPGLTMGLRTGRFHAMVEPRYYVRKDANAFAILGGIGWVF